MTTASCSDPTAIPIAFLIGSILLAYTLGWFLRGRS